MRNPVLGVYRKKPVLQDRQIVFRQGNDLFAGNAGIDGININGPDSINIYMKVF